uniref:Uncharacterized protein n=1 Tax=Corethron hystrix TaxID=216773 RepID=A0A7S1B9W5_9STRA|mmetsp:Transcript_17997/g.40903  ORF Transcript_17997/g.40903 Transcript_17997/m.40903 type:complete len:575 (+) Transcript_17997:1286-3010(+)
MSTFTKNRYIAKLIQKQLWRMPPRTLTPNPTPTSLLMAPASPAHSAPTLDNNTHCFLHPRVCATIQSDKSPHRPPVHPSISDPTPPLRNTPSISTQRTLHSPRGSHATSADEAATHPFLAISLDLDRLRGARPGAAAMHDAARAHVGEELSALAELVPDVNEESNNGHCTPRGWRVRAKMVARRWQEDKIEENKKEEGQEVVLGEEMYDQDKNMQQVLGYKKGSFERLRQEEQCATSMSEQEVVAMLSNVVGGKVGAFEGGGADDNTDDSDTEHGGMGGMSEAVVHCLGGGIATQATFDEESRIGIPACSVDARRAVSATASTSLPVMAIGISPSRDYLLARDIHLNNTGSFDRGVVNNGSRRFFEQEEPRKSVVVRPPRVTEGVTIPENVEFFRPAEGCRNASDFIVRCFVARLRSGITVVKHGRSRWCKSRLRILHVHIDGKSISWKPALGEPHSSKKPPRLDLSTCLEVRHAWSPDPECPGLVGTSILRAKCELQNAHKSFSLIFPKRTVDVTAITADQCKLLMEGMSALCYRLKMANFSRISKQDIESKKSDDEVSNTVSARTVSPMNTP